MFTKYYLLCSELFVFRLTAGQKYIHNGNVQHKQLPKLTINVVTLLDKIRFLLFNRCYASLMNRLIPLTFCEAVQANKRTLPALWDIIAAKLITYDFR